MEEKSKGTIYSRFYNSRVFYPVMLALIAGLCVSIWAVNRAKSNLYVGSITSSYTHQASVSSGEKAPEITAVFEPTEQTTKAAETEPETEKYEANKAYQGDWQNPVNKGKISKDYSGEKLVKSETMGDFRLHAGTDFTAAKGSDIYAINSGKVLDVFTDAFWGVVIMIDHGNGVVAKYCGAEANTTAAKGTIVDKGDKIGSLGIIPCEQKDAPHLHLEITVNGAVADPLQVMNKNNSAE